MKNYLSLFPIPLAILAFVWYGNSVTAQTEIPKSPPCTAGNSVQIVQPEPDIIVINFLMAQEQTRQWVRNEKAKRMAVPCKKAGRIRSPVDEQCWIPNRMPRS